MIQTFKILHKIDGDPETWFVRVSECYQTTRNGVGVSNEDKDNAEDEFDETKI